MSKGCRPGERSLFAFLKACLAPVAQALFPPKCLVCGAFIEAHTSRGRPPSGSWARMTATHFCETCQTGFKRVQSPLCSRCGRPFVSREGEDHLCGDCLEGARHFRKARAFAVYDGPFMEAIHRFKYGKKVSLGRPLAALAGAAFHEFWPRRSVDVVVPVPLHIRRLRQRGFNQAYLTATRWTKEDGLPLDGLNLWRTRWTAPQTGLRRKDRRRNVKGAFALKDSEKIEGRRVLLVDDVYTTGSTVNECSRVLMKAGATRVDVLTLARAL